MVKYYMKKYELKYPLNVNDIEQFFPYKTNYLNYYNPHISVFNNVLCTSFTKKITKSKSWRVGLLKSMISGKKISIINNSFFIINKYSQNYFHWFNDILPKLFYMEKEGYSEKILIPNLFLNFEYIRETLKCFRLNYHFIKRNEIILSEKLMNVGDVASSGAQNPELLFGAIGKIKKKFVVNSNDKNHKELIFISRRNANNRRTLPHGELEGYLESEGYKVIESENLTFKEQVNIFSKCTHLIGVHGAGLTNMVFMSKGSKVLEIKTVGDNKNYCYYFMANAAIHSYYCYLTKGNLDYSLQNSDLYVELFNFKQTLRIFN